MIKKSKIKKTIRMFVSEAIKDDGKIDEFIIEGINPVMTSEQVLEIVNKEIRRSGEKGIKVCRDKDDISISCTHYVPMRWQEYCNIPSLSKKHIKCNAQNIASKAIFRHVRDRSTCGEIVWADDRIPPCLVAKYAKKELRKWRSKGIVEVSGRRVFLTFGV